MVKEEIILNDPSNPNRLSITVWKLDKWHDKFFYSLGVFYFICMGIGALFGFLMGLIS